MNKLTKESREKLLSPRLIRDTLDKMEQAATDGKYELEIEMPSQLDAELLREYLLKLGYRAYEVSVCVDNPKYKKSFFKFGIAQRIYKDNYLRIYWS